jgi:Cell division protein FtsL
LRPETGIALGLLRLPRGLQRSRLLDRLLRGRTSIALVAFALIGIVTLQLGVLKLNSTIGHTLEREARLQRENAALSIENSELSAGDRVGSRAAQLGMELVPIGALRFLSVRPGLDATRGAAALRTPVHSSSSGSAEATAATTTASTASSASTTIEPTGSEAPAPQSTGESSRTPSGEASRASAAPAQQGTGESASAPASAPTPSTAQTPSSTPSPASASPASAAPTGAAEVSSGGGTQAGPTG